MIRRNVVLLRVASGLVFGIVLIVACLCNPTGVHDYKFEPDSETPDSASLLQVSLNLANKLASSQREHDVTAHHSRLASGTPLDSQHAGFSRLVSNKSHEVSAQFAIVALPDTQYYSANQSIAPIYTNQTQWIKDQVEKGNPRNLVFVAGLGDIVDEDLPDQWARANTSMSVLGPPGGPFVLPQGAPPGNHDYEKSSTKHNGADNYVFHFGPQRFASASWYGGADPFGTNAFQLFSGGGIQFLHLALEWMPTVNVPDRSPSPLEWASKVMHEHPGIPTIVSTHEYLDDEMQRRTSHGNDFFHAFVKQYDQVFMVLCGHSHAIPPFQDGGKWYQVSMNEFNHPVIEVLQDFQDYPNGGNGWLRIITFDPAAGQVHFETYSPWLDEYQPDSSKTNGHRTGKFTLPLDFASRLTKGKTAMAAL